MDTADVLDILKRYVATMPVDDMLKVATSKEVEPDYAYAAYLVWSHRRAVEIAGCSCTACWQSSEVQEAVSAEYNKA